MVPIMTEEIENLKKLSIEQSYEDFSKEVAGYSEENIACILAELSKCKCCYRHRNVKFLTQQHNVHKSCKCPCRHLSRHIRLIISDNVTP